MLGWGYGWGLASAWADERVSRAQRPPESTPSHANRSSVSAGVTSMPVTTMDSKRAMVGSRGPWRGDVSEASLRTRSITLPGEPPGGATVRCIPKRGTGQTAFIISGKGPIGSGAP